MFYVTSDLKLKQVSIQWVEGQGVICSQFIKKLHCHTAEFFIVNRGMQLGNDSSHYFDSYAVNWPFRVLQWEQKTKRKKGISAVLLSISVFTENGITVVTSSKAYRIFFWYCVALASADLMATLPCHSCSSWKCIRWLYKNNLLAASQASENAGRFCSPGYIGSAETSTHKISLL